MTAKPPSRDHSLLPGDRLPEPEVEERDGDTAWALFNDLHARENARFADTVPAHLPLKETDPRYADTVPAAGPVPPQVLAHAAGSQPAPASHAATVDDAMLEARRNNRVCPKPALWDQLYQLLEGAGQPLPTPPLTGPAWGATPSLAKRMCLREQIEWADAHGALPVVMDFMKGMREGDWHHMGD